MRHARDFAGHVFLAAPGAVSPHRGDFRMNPPELAAFLKARVRTVRDWPKPKVNFRDITTLFGDPDAFVRIVKQLAPTTR